MFIRQTRTNNKVTGEGWHPLGGGLRQLRLKSFPYVLVYTTDNDAIAIVAFANTHRRPGYWRDRLNTF